VHALAGKKRPRIQLSPVILAFANTLFLRVKPIAPNPTLWIEMKVIAVIFASRDAGELRPL
jgi:hypothetical protein